MTLVLSSRCLPSTPVFTSSSWILPSPSPTYTLLMPENVSGAEGLFSAVPPQSFVNVPPPAKHGVVAQENRYAQTRVFVVNTTVYGMVNVAMAGEFLMPPSPGLTDPSVIPVTRSMAVSAPPLTGTNNTSDCGPSVGLLS